MDIDKLLVSAYLLPISYSSLQTCDRTPTAKAKAVGYIISPHPWLFSYTGFFTVRNSLCLCGFEPDQIYDNTIPCCKQLGAEMKAWQLDRLGGTQGKNHKDTKSTKIKFKFFVLFVPFV